ncbi:hypothetical protein E2C01_047113 [Portunus trituberculatus]|uniref:Uncharacterized protein n=1 Tax=Portunus trituberculatus TaxID=210409 RepID=A0A5B7G9K6_PORTR|nr:hypothetical protein [Portunus trituberculatus]
MYQSIILPHLTPFPATPPVLHSTTPIATRSSPFLPLPASPHPDPLENSELGMKKVMGRGWGWY